MSRLLGTKARRAKLHGKGSSIWWQGVAAFKLGVRLCPYSGGPNDNGKARAWHKGWRAAQMETQGLSEHRTIGRP